MDGVNNVDEHAAYCYYFFARLGVHTKIKALASFGFGKGHMLEAFIKQFRPTRVFGLEPSPDVFQTHKRESAGKHSKIHFHVECLDLVSYCQRLSTPFLSKTTHAPPFYLFAYREMTLCHEYAVWRDGMLKKNKPKPKARKRGRGWGRGKRVKRAPPSKTKTKAKLKPPPPPRKKKEAEEEEEKEYDEDGQYYTLDIQRRIPNLVYRLLNSRHLQEDPENDRKNRKIPLHIRERVQNGARFSPSFFGFSSSKPQKEREEKEREEKVKEKGDEMDVDDDDEDEEEGGVEMIDVSSPLRKKEKRKEMDDNGESKDEERDEDDDVMMLDSSKEESSSSTTKLPPVPGINMLPPPPGFTDISRNGWGEENEMPSMSTSTTTTTSTSDHISSPSPSPKTKKMKRSYRLMKMQDLILSDPAIVRDPRFMECMIGEYQRCNGIIPIPPPPQKPKASSTTTTTTSTTTSTSSSSSPDGFEVDDDSMEVDERNDVKYTQYFDTYAACAKKLASIKNLPNYDSYWECGLYKNNPKKYPPKVSGYYEESAKAKHFKDFPKCDCYVQRKWQGMFDLGMMVSVGQYLRDDDFEAVMECLSLFCDYLYFDVVCTEGKGTLFLFFCFLFCGSFLFIDYVRMETGSQFDDPWAFKRSKAWYRAVVKKNWRIVSNTILESKFLNKHMGNVPNEFFVF